MNVEDQLRAAGRAVRDQVRDLPELDLMRSGPAHPGTRPGAPRRWRAGWLIPLAAAAAVIIVAATLVSVRALSGPARPGAGQPGTATSGAAANPSQVPAYYAAITKPTAAGPYDVTIADTATGKALFTIKPPKNTSFASVAAAGDDRTFVVSVGSFPLNSSPPMAALSWDLLRFSPGATGYTLRRLPIPATPPKTVIDGLALSPDGTELAVMVHPDTLAGFIGGQATLRIYSVATGQVLHTWQSAGGQTPEAIGADGISADTTIRWLANGHELAFAWDAVERGQGYPKVTPEVWRLDLAKPRGSSLLAGDARVVTIPAGVNGSCSAVYPTADGTSAVCGTQAMVPCQETLPPLVFRAYSGDEGSFRVLYTVPSAKAPKGKCIDGIASVFWASPSGSTLVGMVSTAPASSSGVPGQYTSVVGVIAHGRWTPLPIRVQLSQLAGLAF